MSLAHRRVQTVVAAARQATDPGPFTPADFAAAIAARGMTCRDFRAASIDTREDVLRAYITQRYPRTSPTSAAGYTLATQLYGVALNACIFASDGPSAVDTLAGEAGKISAIVVVLGVVSLAGAVGFTYWLVTRHH